MEREITGQRDKKEVVAEELREVQSKIDKLTDCSGISLTGILVINS